MPYLFVAIIIASFASGYGFVYKVSQLEIKEMADSIASTILTPQEKLAQAGFSVDELKSLLGI